MNVMSNVMKIHCLLTSMTSGRVYTLIVLHHNRNTKKRIIRILSWWSEHHLWWQRGSVNISGM